MIFSHFQYNIFFISEKILLYKSLLDPIISLPPSQSNQSQSYAHQHRKFNNQTTKDPQHHQDSIQHRLRCGVQPHQT